MALLSELCFMQQLRAACAEVHAVFRNRVCVLIFLELGIDRVALASSVNVVPGIFAKGPSQRNEASR